MIKFIGILVVIGLIVFWWLKRPHKYREPLPPGDPKSTDFKPFWNRGRQNRLRFQRGCFGYIMFVCAAMLIYWLGQNYRVVNIKAQDNQATITQMQTIDAMQTVEYILTQTPAP